MLICSTCEVAMPDQAKYCMKCGSELANGVREPGDARRDTAFKSLSVLHETVCISCGGTGICPICRQAVKSQMTWIGRGEYICGHCHGRVSNTLYGSGPCPLCGGHTGCICADGKCPACNGVGRLAA
ncbi:MAG: zinc ribbon domain-containing protein [Dehalococcoidia bacterium]|nr:zinc ribbon domain-containing protein [Dehalococcoidia bacterium]